MITEKDYSSNVGLNHRKKYGQFFTPEFISDFMTDWILRDNPLCHKILEPAFGLGVFSRSILRSKLQIEITGYDVDDRILGVAKNNFSSKSDIVSIKKIDYLESNWDEKYDAIICNPPYLKFHDYDNGRYIPQVNGHLGTNLNGFTNIYTLFLLKSIAQLNEGGRLAYIIPSEFLNSDYGVEVKRALLQSGTLRHLIIVDFTECAFDDALTTACILFCEKDNKKHDIRFSTIKDVSDLSLALTDYVSYNTSELDAEIKWKQYYEATSSSKYQNLVPFSTFAKVTRGIATGANEFFTFKNSKLDNFNISDACVLPCICHAQDVKTQIFTLDDFHLLANQDKSVYLFNGCGHEQDPNVRSYLTIGLDNKYDKRYLCASRKPWYALENRPPSPIWVSVFNRSGLRFVRNEANIRNLTTFHCVYVTNEVDTDILFSYLLTNVAKEIFLDNSRQYGNGLIKFEPNDLNKGKCVDLRLLADVEKSYILNILERIRRSRFSFDKQLKLLDDFFTAKYTEKQINIEAMNRELEECPIDIEVPTPVKTQRIKQLNLLDLFCQYQDNNIVENMVVQDTEVVYKSVPCSPFIDKSKNVLISLVKNDNTEHFVDKSAKIYYTGKKFPSTVALNKLYYFMPYIKGKGIRDLYLIKIARVGARKEGEIEENRSDFRLVFEIEYITQLFNDYKPIELNIWHTYTDTTISALL